MKGWKGGVARTAGTSLPPRFHTSILPLFRRSGALRSFVGLTALSLLAGCRSQDPIVGRWEPASGGTKLAWRFAADGTGGFDTSRLEADLKQRAKGKPLSPPLQKLLDAEKAKTFRWKREGAYYRLEAPQFQRTEKGSFLFAQLENGELRFSPAVSAPSNPQLVLRRAAD